MSEKLEPCPFCGRDVEIIRIGGGWFWRHKNGEYPDDCPIKWSRKYKTAEEAAAAWNHRPAPEANESMTLEELRGMDGQPVWIERMGQWALVDATTDITLFMLWDESCGTAKDCYDMNIFAYRRPPDGGEG